MELLYFIGIIFTASILQAITGFGGALIAAPLLLLLVDKTTSLVALTFGSLAINSILLLSIRSPLNKRTFYNLFLPGLIGLPIGLWILRTLPTSALRLLVLGLSIIFGVMLLWKKVPVKSTDIKKRFAGWFSGILTTSVGLNSPPVALILAAENTDKDEMRKTLASYFLIMSVFSLALLVSTGHITKAVLYLPLRGVPPAILGSLIGNMISRKISQRGFIWGVFVLLASTVAVGLFSAFSN